MTQARRAHQEGRLEDSQSILINVVVREPNNDEAWLLLAETIDNRERKLECLERAKRIDPRNPATLRAIHALQQEIADTAFLAELGSEPKPVQEPKEAEPIQELKPRTGEQVVIPVEPDLAHALIRYAQTLANALLMSTEPQATRALGLELVQQIEQAARHDEMLARRWARSGGRDALVKYERAVTILITNLPQSDPQLPKLREQRQRALVLFK